MTALLFDELELPPLAVIDKKCKPPFTPKAKKRKQLFVLQSEYSELNGGRRCGALTNDDQPKQVADIL